MPSQSADVWRLPQVPRDAEMSKSPGSQSKQPPGSISPAELRAQAHHILNAYLFIHIPKTGGSSIEEELRSRHLLERNSILGQSQECCTPHGFILQDGDCCFPGPPWHLAPDVFERVHRRSFDHVENGGLPGHRRPRWCIVRNPEDRYGSCIDWSLREVTEPFHDGRGYPYPVDKEGSAHAALFAGGRFNVPWGTNDRASHWQPQWWFVWNAHGQVQCDCVVAIEKLEYFTNVQSNTVNDSVAQGGHKYTLPVSLRHNLYKRDVELWRQAKSSPGVCYRPAQLQDKHTTRNTSGYTHKYWTEFMAELPDLSALTLKSASRARVSLLLGGGTVLVLCGLAACLYRCFYHRPRHNGAVYRAAVRSNPMGALDAKGVEPAEVAW